MTRLLTPAALALARAVSTAFAQTLSPTILPVQRGRMADRLFKVAAEALYLADHH
ncbi:hypothetical protein [Methylobacterium sp. 77]|uniref:hypothetical protein n=1 Tax=Methylobacterium sp. 77 TaxID=1101192 RepID=UPI00036E2C12|nr:hypothetical protein [Methylobacterium sp. 77]